MVTLCGINKSFQKTPVLKNVSATFPDGKTIVLIGPSGSGKSTLLRCINLLETPESGTLSIGNHTVSFGHPLKSREILSVRRSSGMVFQGFHLFPHRTVLQNVIEGPVYVLRRPKEEAEAEAIQLLDKVGLKEKADSYPEQLSGGQQQRVAIARAMAMNPQFLLFDEPTSALDPELEAEVLKVLRQLSKEGNSMLIVTHNLSFAKEVADEILFLDQGKIQFRGTPGQVFTGCPSARVQEFISAMLPSYEI